VVFHHGFRQPCYCYLPTMLEQLKFEHPDYWQVITNGGELSERLALLTQAPATLKKSPRAAKPATSAAYCRS